MPLSKFPIFDERDARILWSLIIEPGDQVAHDFIDEFDSAFTAIVLVIGSAQWAGTSAKNVEYSEGLQRWRARLSDISIQVVKNTIARLNLTVLIPGDDLWPQKINRLGNDAPIILYVRGDAELLARKAIALVGARAATTYGEHVTMEFAAALAHQDYVTVAGGAYGIDAVAHRSTLAARGKTIAVLAGGVDRFHPTGNDQLLQHIADGGAVVSEMPPGTVPTKWRFMQRNRLIAALVEVLVIVEAGSRSGVLDTANHAVRLGVPLGVVPGPIYSPTSAGCHRLLREFVATCITSTDDVLALARELEPVLADPSTTPAQA
jgi:DNA processing protein